MTASRSFWASFNIAGRRYTLGPFATRSNALSAALNYGSLPRRKSLYTGYGANAPCFDIRWHDSELDEVRRQKQVQRQKRYVE